MKIIEEVQKRLDHNKLHEQFLLDTLETLKTKVDIFNNGVAYVKDDKDGNVKPCVIVGVDLPNFREVLDGHKEVYIRVMTKNGQSRFSLNQLVPFNEKSKALFGK
jgi:hypothetical protein